MKLNKFVNLLMIGLVLAYRGGLQEEPAGMKTIHGRPPEPVADDASTRPLPPVAPNAEAIGSPDMIPHSG